MTDTTTRSSSPQGAVSRRSTIHLTPATLAILGDQPKPSMSGRIAQIVESYSRACDAAGLTTGMDDAPALSTMLVRYRAIITGATPVLSESEWSLICDVLNGSWLVAESSRLDPARFLDHEIFDCQADGMGEKWHVDVPALVATLERLPYAGLCAVMEVVARYWSAPTLPPRKIRALLIECGARVAD